MTPSAPWTDALRTGTFRTAVLTSAAFTAGTLLLFGFIFWQTAGYEGDRIDLFILHEAEAIAREPPQDVVRDVAARFAGDLHRQTFAAVLSAGRLVLAGDLETFPPALPVDGMLHVVDAARHARAGATVERVTAVARTLPDGRILVVGRSRRELARLTLLVTRALVLGIVPALLLALGVGFWASMRTMKRVAAFSRTLDGIMDGGLEDRLPAPGTSDTLDILAGSVNRMLDELASVLGEMRHAGNTIAHDLKTPLSRMRARLEGARRRARTLDELDQAAERAIADLDQCFAIVTALLRIGELEGARRRSNFAEVSLSAIVEEVGDLYQPIAEQRGQRFTVDAPPGVLVHGDRDLLCEMCANLVDNAVKFAPEGGSVTLAAGSSGGVPYLRVSDSGEGIAVGEREAVLRRFFRSERTSQAEGTGLGLSLVAAILRLHGFHLAMLDLRPGFAMEVVFRHEPELSGPPSLPHSSR